MRLPRMTTRRWMVVVAVVAILNWVGLMAWRSNHYSGIARDQLRMVRALEEAEGLLQTMAQLEQEPVLAWKLDPGQGAGEGGTDNQDHLRSLLGRNKKYPNINIKRGTDSQDHQRILLEYYKKYSNIKEQHQAVAKRYQYAATHPWLLSPLNP